ncbi:hypothetical protein L6452_00302 [Arctium lappa]|uniref:Uncharacterized protein n=1 Tax=Arctium lappa TaxID=4217 RepID=A0ACB9FDG7_ARCLA|nr:hypothetical protein L6452_00302 [Arctium lappa]
MAAFSIFFLCFTISFHSHYTFAMKSDTIFINQTIKDGQTIVSPKQTFELGFFTPGNASENQYLAIWLTVTSTGDAGRFTWVNGTQRWFEFSSLNADSCEAYGTCGVYAACNTTQSTTPCGCLEGFDPKSRAEWGMSNWTRGCRREVALDCGVREGFRKYQFVTLPDTRRSWYDTNMTLEQCNIKCRNECNCTTYATLDVKYGTGYLVWYEELIDMRAIPRDGQDIYIYTQMVALQLGNVEEKFN